MKTRILTGVNAARAAQIHTQSFEAGWGAESLTSHIEKDICLGVFNPDLFGFIILQSAADQAEIITLAIASDHRRNGAARRLVEAGCQALAEQGVDVIFLEVAEDNTAAIALYKACGFAPMGRRPAYYRRAGGRVAALTFQKNL